MTPIQEILLLHHSHLDAGYTHSQPIQWALQSEYIGQVVRWLEETRDMIGGARPKWTCEATEPVRRWLRSATSLQKEQFRGLVHEGRIGLTALRWHATPLANRAGLCRLLDGKHELEDQLGVKIPVACQHDVTGVPWPLADVLLDAGVDFFVMAINVHLGRAVKPRPGMFLWEAPSGRTIRVWNGNHYTMFDQLLNAWDNSVDRMAEGWSAYENRLKELEYPLDFVYLTSTCSPVMWDNAPNNPFLPPLIQSWNEAKRGPRIRYATMDDLRERASTVPEETLPVLRGDWTDFWNFGCASSPVSTARNQAAKPLLEAVEAMEHCFGGAHPALSEAYDQIDAYDEHTFGYFDSQPSHPQSQTTELLKQALAHQGHELAAFALMDGLERLAQNPLQDRGVERVLLCNPGPLPTTIVPRLPESWFGPPERTYRASRMFFDGRSWDSGFPGSSTREFAPVEVAPNSWQVLSLDELREAQPSTVRHEIEVKPAKRRELNFAPAADHERTTGYIESPYHKLTYDPVSGRIFSLVDRLRQTELLAVRPGIDCFSFVREHTDALSEDRRYAYYQRDLNREKLDENCWQNWSPIREKATRVTECRVTGNAAGTTLERTLQAPGMRHLVQRFIFSALDPVIRIELELELEPEESPQSLYFAVPLSLKRGWEAAFDTAGTQVLLDQDQLPGACRNWVTVETLATMRDKDGGVALFAYEAPLVQFGDFRFERPQDKIERTSDPLLLAWPVNNYWDTNFPRVPAGRIRLHYGLLSFKPEATFAELRAQAQRFRKPVLIWPVTKKGRAKGSGQLTPFQE